MSPKVLIDENLPQTLLAKLGVGTTHATKLGERMSNAQLWSYAREHRCVILTKDAGAGPS